MILYKLTHLGRSWNQPQGPLSLYYEVGKVTRAAPKTMGIFCFESLDEARQYRVFKVDELYIVRSIGRVRRPKIRWHSSHDELFTAPRRWVPTCMTCYLRNCKDSTVCCPAVEVLEEVTE